MALEDGLPGDAVKRNRLGAIASFTVEMVFREREGQHGLGVSAELDCQKIFETPVGSPVETSSIKRALTMRP